MVLRSNMNAMYSSRQLNSSNNEVATSLKKLASGYEINSAADDAAGVAVTEKMRAQISGLEQGTSNACDGLSLIQTAEGAMGEIHNMLNRMVELATKSANGTIQDEVDREAIQAEVDVFCHEVERIATSTNFNGIKLFDGSLAEIQQTGALLSAANETNLSMLDGDIAQIQQTGELLAAGNKANANIVGGGLTLHIGDSSSTSHKITVYVDELSMQGLKLDTINVSNQDDSGAAITVLQDAINKVSTNRCNLGAINNRLEYTIRNNSVTSENVTSAKSVIADTEMANEMIQYTKMNTMTQASQSMLAHSNQNIQGILELLG